MEGSLSCVGTGLQPVLYMAAKQMVVQLIKEGSGELHHSHAISQVTVMKTQLKSRGKPRSELNAWLSALCTCKLSAGYPKWMVHWDCYQPVFPKQGGPISALSSSMPISSPVGRSRQSLRQAVLRAHPSPCVAQKEHKQEARSHRKLDYRSFSVHRSIIFNTSIAVPRVRKEHLISPSAKNLGR